MAKKSILTRAQRKQYELLHSRFRLSEKRFKEYWEDLRKSRKKIRDLNRRGTILPGGLFSLKVDRLKTLKEFNARFKSIKATLKKDYVRTVQKSSQKDMIQRLSNFFGVPANDPVLKLLKSLKPKDFFKFINSDSDIKNASFYNKGDDNATILEFIEGDLQSFKDRLMKFIKELKVGKSSK